MKEHQRLPFHSCSSQGLVIRCFFNRVSTPLSPSMKKANVSSEHWEREIDIGIIDCVFLQSSGSKMFESFASLILSLSLTISFAFQKWPFGSGLHLTVILLLILPAFWCGLSGFYLCRRFFSERYSRRRRTERTTSIPMVMFSHEDAMRLHNEVI